ncbi:MAG: ATP12 family protein [Rhodospirillaceae bacterium]
MAEAGAKRFYTLVESVAVDGGYRVELDGRAVRTPAGNPLVLPTAALADGIRDEWDAQEAKIDPASMPLMQLACTAADRVAPNRSAILDQTANYGATDLLCYFSDGPKELVQRQREGWQPFLDWAEQELSAPLVAAMGVLHVPQPETSLSRLRDALAALDDWNLTAAAHLTQVLGSLVLALAVCRGRLAPVEAFRLSVIDDHFQAERWGEDREAVQRLRALEREVEGATVFLERLRS